MQAVAVLCRVFWKPIRYLGVANHSTLIAMGSDLRIKEFVLRTCHNFYSAIHSFGIVNKLLHVQ